MKYPGLFVGICLGMGVFWGHRTPGEFWSPGVVCLSVGALLYVVGRRLHRQKIVSAAPTLYMLSSLLALFTTGLLNTLALRMPDPTGVAGLVSLGSSIEIRGSVHSVRVLQYGGYEIDFEANAARGDSTDLPVSGRVLVAFGNPPPGRQPDVHKGDRLTIRGRLMPLPTRRNPHDFDLKAYYVRRGISAVFEPENEELVAIEHDHGGLGNRVDRMRQALRSRILAIHSSEAAQELLPALLLGYRSDVSFDTRDDFRSSGLSHLLAISGLHVGIIGLSLYWLFGTVLMRLRVPFLLLKWWRSIGAIGVLFLFAMLSGGAPSVQRAVVMAAVFFVSSALGKKTDLWNTLGLSAGIMLTVDPSQLNDVGFQLSFAALTGILLFHGAAAGRAGIGAQTSRFFRFVSSSVSISCAATGSTLPVLLFHFGAAPLGGIAVNLLAIPVLTLLLFSALLSTVLGDLLFLSDATQMLSAALSSIASLSASPVTPFTLVSATGVVFSAGFIPFALLAACGSRRRRTRSWFVLCALFLAVLSNDRSSNQLSVTFLDVGQGDAAIILTPAHKTIVVDTGPGFASARSISRHLHSVGVRKIDVLLLSHYHDDHIGGWNQIENAVPISRVIGPAVDSKMEDEIQDLIGSVNYAASGDTVSVEPGVLLEIFGPAQSRGSTGGRAEVNDASLIVKIIFGSTSFLFTGDAEAASEFALVTSFGSALASDVVKVAHHGSKTSSSVPFVERTRARWAVVSVGKSNRFGHPDDGVLRRWEAGGTSILRTDLSGGINFTSDGRSVHHAPRGNNQ